MVRMQDIRMPSKFAPRSSRGRGDPLHSCRRAMLPALGLRSLGPVMNRWRVATVAPVSPQLGSPVQGHRSREESLSVRVERERRKGMFQSTATETSGSLC